MSNYNKPLFDSKGTDDSPNWIIEFLLTITVWAISYVLFVGILTIGVLTIIKLIEFYV